MRTPLSLRKRGSQIHFTKAHKESIVKIFFLLTGLIVLAISPAAGANEKIVGVEHRVTSISVYDGKPLTLYIEILRKPPTTEFWELNEKRCQEFFKPEATDPIVVQALPWDSKIPNSSRMDYAMRTPLTDARQITVPTMMIVR